MSVMRRWTIITIVTVLVILLAGYELLVKPQKSKVSDYQSQAQQQELANEQLTTQIAALQAEQKELPQQQQALQKFSTQIPNDPEEPTLIRQFTTAAHGAGVDLRAITPAAPTAVTGSTASGAQTLGAAPTPTEALSELSISLQITGSYPNVESFFESLEKLPRALTVVSFTVSPGASTGSTTSGATLLTVTISTNVFFTPPADTTSTTGTQTLTPTTTATTPPPTTTTTTAPSTPTTPAVTTPTTPAQTS